MLVSLGYTLHQNMITVCPPFVWQVVSLLQRYTAASVLRYWQHFRILWTGKGFVWRGHGLYFGFSSTVSKGFGEKMSALLVMVYFKTVSICVCKKLRKPGSGLWINENCLGRGHGLFQIAILTFTQNMKIKPSQWLVPCSRPEFNSDRHSIPENLNLLWKKAGSLELSHYSPHLYLHCYNEHQQQYSIRLGKQTSVEHHQQSNPRKNTTL